ncbi:MAG TPA: cell division protein FtsL [Bdellovibrionota bacterium]|nr:cell division protein FtsL [Bdellovibrionota bacterium]
MEASSIRTQRVSQRGPKLQKFVPLFMILIFVGAILWFYAWTRVQVVKLHYQIIELARIEAELAKHSNKLRVQLATLKSPSRIEYIAKNQLRLKDPTQEQVIFLK